MIANIDSRSAVTSSAPSGLEAQPPLLRFIEREELRTSLERGEPIVLLEALPERYYRKAHLPGARLLPPDRVAELAPSLIPSQSSPVVVYCASDTCRNSDQVAAALEQLHYANVRVYRGGKADWQAAGQPVEGG